MADVGLQPGFEIPFPFFGVRICEGFEDLAADSFASRDGTAEGRVLFLEICQLVVDVYLGTYSLHGCDKM